MNNFIDTMLKKYHCQTRADYENALHEMIQQIALLGLWRAKFFEHAAFYGGTALRILHGLDRFSEDLDFSLKYKDTSFDLDKYNQAITSELSSFGFEVKVEKKIKHHQQSSIRSAFIKANTRQQFLNIAINPEFVTAIHKDKLIKVKMEIDVDPPLQFQTEAKLLLDPIPFSVVSFSLPCLFAGKLHALLCRSWQHRVKGRDWYDLIWYLRQGIQPNLIHLQTRLQQSKHWPHDQLLDQTQLKQLLLSHIQTVDFEQAKQDVLPFLIHHDSVNLWSATFFTQLIETYF